MYNAKQIQKEQTFELVSIQLFQVVEGHVMEETLQNHKSKGTNPVKANLKIKIYFVRKNEKKS